MKNRNKLNTIHLYDAAALFRPVPTSESGWCFFMQKFKYIPPDICNRCLDVLAAEIGKLEVQQTIHPEPKEFYRYKRLKLDAQVIYYKHILKHYERLD